MVQVSTHFYRGNVVVPFLYTCPLPGVCYSSTSVTQGVPGETGNAGAAGPSGPRVSVYGLSEYGKTVWKIPPECNQNTPNTEH